MMTTMLLEPPRTQVQSPSAPVRSPLLAAFALAEQLEALAGCVDRVSDADYLTPAADGGVTSPVGALVRQCVDFVLALLDRPAGEVMTYDGRGADGHAIEHNRRLAMVMLRGLAARVRDMAPRTSDVPITVDVPLGRLGGRARLRSSLGRELIFVLQQVPWPSA